MSAQIKEAIALLPKLGALFADAFAGANTDKPADAIAVIAAALETAKREAEAWEILEHEWRLHGWGDLELKALFRGPWQIKRQRHSTGSLFHFEHASREVVLRAAASWCRAEMAKT